jgi:diguanylate cyclase (GGDEF)-like protein/PAS domain S-box-containing protein
MTGNLNPFDDGSCDVKPAEPHRTSALEDRAQQFLTLIEQAPLGVFILDDALRMAVVNPAGEAVFGGIPDLLGREFAEVLSFLLPGEVAAAIMGHFRHTLESGEPHHQPELTEVRREDGSSEFYDWRIHRVRLPDGRHGVACYFSDVSGQVGAQRSVARSESRYRTLFESIDEGFCIIEVVVDGGGRPVDYRFLEVNPAFEQQTGLVEAVGRTAREMVPDIEASWIELYGKVALTGAPVRFVDWAQALGRWFDVYAFRVDAPEDRRVALLFNDITARKRAEQALVESEAQLHHRAHHDLLTGLPNRLLFEDRVRQAVATAARHERKLAVLFLDFDGFKLINDSLGHAAGDSVLCEATRRLRTSLRESDTLARLHGDELAVLLTEVSDEADAERVARELLATLMLPMVVAGRPVSVSASIGVSLYPHDGDDPSALLRAADAAMYQAKIAGKNAVRHFTPAMRTRAEERLAIADSLDGAVERGEITVCYQPQWDHRTGRISAFEALLRWSSPALGDVSPRDFVAVAEERGTFRPILSWSLHECASFAKGVSSGFGAPIQVGFNVTPTRLVSPGFLRDLESTILEFELEPHQLELEIEMRAMLGSFDALRDAVLAVRRMGVRATLDRWGLDADLVTVMLDLPLDGAKIPPALVQRAGEDERLRRGLASLVGLAHDLGLDVTAVGIETEAQRELMLELGCERLQGELIGSPMNREAAVEALRDQDVVTLF